MSCFGSWCHSSSCYIHCSLILFSLLPQGKCIFSAKAMDASNRIPYPFIQPKLVNRPETAKFIA
jgi:hypothetical protein